MTTYIDDKADRFLGRSYMLNNSQEVGVLSFLFGKPLDKGIEIENAYINAKNTIWSCKELLHYDMVFYEEDEFSDFSAELSAEMEKYPEDSMD